MKVVVTGATGFIGRHVVARLLERGHDVVACARDAERARTMPWFGHVEFIGCDLHADFRSVVARESDALVHLAWPGLPNYKDYFHVQVNLPADLAFLKAAVDAGCRHLVVAGTCLEYGMQYGPLTESMETRPTTPYGFAKDTLRKALELLREASPYTLQWMRLFYMYGDGQNPGSLLAQLNRAIDEGRASFDMSMGDQLRDYLPVEDVAANFVVALENPRCEGIINCSSGKPISVIDFVERRCRERASPMVLNRGRYPYPAYEPLAFWGVPSKLNDLVGLSD